MLFTKKSETLEQKIVSITHSCICNQITLHDTLSFIMAQGNLNAIFVYSDELLYHVGDEMGRSDEKTTHSLLDMYGKSDTDIQDKCYMYSTSEVTFIPYTHDPVRLIVLLHSKKLNEKLNLLIADCISTMVYSVNHSSDQCGNIRRDANDIAKELLDDDELIGCIRFTDTTDQGEILAEHQKAISMIYEYLQTHFHSVYPISLEKHTYIVALTKDYLSEIIDYLKGVKEEIMNGFSIKCKIAFQLRKTDGSSMTGAIYNLLANISDLPFESVVFIDKQMEWDDNISSVDKEEIIDAETVCDVPFLSLPVRKPQNNLDETPVEPAEIAPSPPVIADMEEISGTVIENVLIKEEQEVSDDARPPSAFATESEPVTKSEPTIKDPGQEAALTQESSSVVTEIKTPDAEVQKSKGKTSKKSIDYKFPPKVSWDYTTRTRIGA